MDEVCQSIVGSTVGAINNLVRIEVLEVTSRKECITSIVALPCNPHGSIFKHAETKISHISQTCDGHVT